MNSLSSGAKKMADNLTGEVIETNEMFHNESNPSSSAPKTTTGLQSQRQNQSPQNHQEITQLQVSASSQSSFGVGNDYVQSLENFLERNWNNSGSFMMEQSRHFDIASMLTCLYKLKRENVDLEEEVAAYKRRRDHLLAINSQLAVPHTSRDNGNQVLQTNNDTETTSETTEFIQQPRLNKQQHIGNFIHRPWLNNQINHENSIQHSRSDYQINHEISIQQPRSNHHDINNENIDRSLQIKYPNHSMSNSYQTQNTTIKIPIQVSIRVGDVEGIIYDNKRQNNQN